MRVPSTHVRVVGAMLVVLAVAAIPGAAQGQIAPFTNEATLRGLSYLTAVPLAGGVTSGVSIGFADLDGDMDPDVVCMGKETGEIGLFENTGGFFVNRGAGSGLPTLVNASSFGAGDYDGDGDLDLVFTTWGNGIFLMRNDGAFHFTDVTAAAGLQESMATRGVSWGDLDGDGWIDLYVCNYLNAIPGSGASRNRVWHNNGNGTFTDVAPILGLDDTAYSFMAVLSDADLDGDLDVYLSNDRGMDFPFKPNRFLRNDRGVFTDVGAQNGTALALYSMGVACGDLDGNGLPDFYCTNLPSPVPPLMGENPLLLQHPGGTFVQVQGPWGVEVKKASWAAIFLDVDNDADQDLYVVNQLVQNSLFLKGPSLPMTDVALSAGIGGPVGTLTMDYCASAADVDGDGDLDIIQNNQGSNVRLFINHEGQLRSWVRFRVVGEGHDTHALGATVRVRTGALWQMRQVLSGGNGYLSQNDGLLHFGLGTSMVMDEIQVTWPNTGSTRTLTGYGAKKIWRLLPPSRLGDADGDGDVDQADLSAFAVATPGPLVPGEEAFDFNGDGTLDGADAAGMLAAFNGRLGDFDGNGVVNGADLAILIEEWGAFGSVANLDLDGRVDGLDLGLLLGQWG